MNQKQNTNTQAIAAEIINALKSQVKKYLLITLAVLTLGYALYFLGFNRGFDKGWDKGFIRGQENPEYVDATETPEVQS